ncbi:hypothetical protein KI387_032232, partial [Taxus chinensis]
SKESTPNSPTLPENVEEPNDEEMKDGEEGKKEADETTTKTAQDIAEQAMNLEIQVPKG